VSGREENSEERMFRVSDVHSCQLAVLLPFHHTETELDHLIVLFAMLMRMCTFIGNKFYFTARNLLLILASDGDYSRHSELWSVQRWVVN